MTYTFWPPRQPSREDSVTDNLDAYIKAYNKRPDAGHAIAYRYMWFEYRGGTSGKTAKLESGRPNN